MSDSRYAHSTLPSEPARDTEVDSPRIVALRFEPHRIAQTLHFPRLSDNLDDWTIVEPQ